MLVGGLVGGFIGHQLGRGNARKVATVIGTIAGAKIGHDVVNGHSGHGSHEIARYEEPCETRYEVDYEKVIDGYDVTYNYRGRSYQIEMPYDPGKRIKMRVQFAPVF